MCLAVQAGFDTDCNGTTVGSVLGMLLGFDRIGREWTDPLKGTLETGLIEVGVTKIDALIEHTMAHCETSDHQ